uniref:Uncharacterized protein n=1 Tax=Anguilla anguilla TaxID=7936 RepID=A0A0E9R6V0_ANGAN
MSFSTQNVYPRMPDWECCELGFVKPVSGGLP